MEEGSKRSSTCTKKPKRVRKGDVSDRGVAGAWFTRCKRNMADDDLRGLLAEVRGLTSRQQAKVGAILGALVADAAGESRRMVYVIYTNW